MPCVRVRLHEQGVRDHAGGEEREWYLAGSGLVDHEGGLRELRLASPKTST